MRERTEPGSQLRRPTEECRRCEELCIGIVATTRPEGVVHAAVHVQGQMCDRNASQFVQQIDDLLDLGITDIDVHCESAVVCLRDPDETFELAFSRIRHSVHGSAR